MARARTRWTVALLACLAVIAAFSLRQRIIHQSSTPLPALPAPSMQHEPLTMLWAWETPEDLTTLDPSNAGVAFLSRELLLGSSLQVRPRQQPLHLPPNTWVMAVVRIETAPSFAPGGTSVSAVAHAIAAVAEQPSVRAVQVDFDATASQRAFYADVLTRLRPQLPPNMPLSVTALVSWCGDTSWLRGLPIDEAVPMFFRMGGPAAIRATRPRDTASIREPLCRASVGISTDEAWPPINNRQRVYVFHPGSWTQPDLARVNTLGYHGLIGDSVR